jgi:hypothetical protein
MIASKQKVRNKYQTTDGMGALSQQLTEALERIGTRSRCAGGWCERAWAERCGTAPLPHAVSAAADRRLARSLLFGR